MNPSAIYSKSGKGVQEASGKTSLLKRSERAVLSAIDGRSTVSEVAKKVGKPLDAAFEALITQLDNDGFVREVSGAAGAPVTKPPAKAAKGTTAKAAGPTGRGDHNAPDLDFTGILSMPVEPPTKPASDSTAGRRANEQEAALYKARQQAELRAQEERERARAEAEAKTRAEAEAKFRADTEKKLREETARKLREETDASDAKARAAREAAARIATEAKARAEADAQAKIEAERRAREEAERKAREVAEQARREADELRQRLEEERKAREEAERKARDEAERKAREEAERREREEAERKAREEAERKEREEAERKAREEAEQARREAEELRQRLEEERKAREEAERKAREEAALKVRAEQDAQMRRAREDADRRRERAERERREAKDRDPPEAVAPAAGEAAAPAPQPEADAERDAAGLEALMADLASFSQRDEGERKAREDAEEGARAERERKLREENEQRELQRAEQERQEAEERSQREEDERRAREEAERLAREDEERLAREDEERRASEEERARLEAQEARERSEREALAAKVAQVMSDDIGVTEADIGLEEVHHDEAAAKESRKARREREREAKRRAKEEAREREREARDRAATRTQAGAPADLVRARRRPRKWGRSAAIALLVILVAGIGALHVLPIPADEYERAASEALRQPVHIGSARLSLFNGVRLNLADVRVGASTRIASARAYPTIGSLLGGPAAFSRIELDGVSVAQEALGEALLARTKGPNFSVDRILLKDVKLEGPVALPLLEADIRIGNDGAVRTVQLVGPEGLLGQLTPKDGGVDFDVTANSFTLPFAPDVSLSSFAMKGRATRHGMKIDAWGGSMLGGALSGTANVRWGGAWQLDGVLTARGVNAAALAPALLSQGTAEATGKFSMSGSEPAKLARAGRVEGSFTIGKGVLGSFDLARAIRTDGREVKGRTQFAEMNGQATYDRGAVALRNVTIGAGALQAGASADIAQSGALSGRIVADIRTASQSLRTTLHLGGTLKDPQVRN